MKMTQEPEPSMLKRVLGFLFFFLIALDTLISWVWELFDLYQQVSLNADIITLHKGELYMFGVFVLSQP
jgi:hypothetical protein